MRNLSLTTSLLLLAYCSLAQKTFVQDGKLNGIIPLNAEGAPSYQVVKEINGVTKADLFKRARKWFVNAYNSPKQVLQTNDSETGELTAKGLFNVSLVVMGITTHADVYHTLSVEVKDSKYRITLNSFLYEPTRSTIDKIPGAGKNMYNSLFIGIDKEAVSLIASLEKALATVDDF